MSTEVPGAAPSCASSLEAPTFCFVVVGKLFSFLVFQVVVVVVGVGVVVVVVVVVANTIKSLWLAHLQSMSNLE